MGKTKAATRQQNSGRLQAPRGRVQNLTNAGKGRPPGVPNKVTSEAKAACSAIVDDPIYRKNLLERMQKGTAGAMEPILWYYAKGKPKERVELGADESIRDLIRKAAKLPPLPKPEGV